MTKLFVVVWTNDKNGAIDVALFTSSERALQSVTAHYGAFRSWDEFDTYFSDHACGIFDGMAYRADWQTIED